MVKLEELEKIVNCLEWLLNNMVDNSTNHRILNYVGPSVLANKPIIEDALALLKEREPRVMTWDEVKKKINSGEYVFTECEKERQRMRYGYSKLAIDNGDECKIAFLSTGDREYNPHAVWWWVSYRNYNKTWRCWTSCPTAKQRETVKWE